MRVVGIDAGGTKTVGLLADVVVAIPSGPEVLSGSTRLKAGSATKAALNAITTAAMVRLGKAYGPLMVDVQPTSAELRARARRIVSEAAGIGVRAGIAGSFRKGEILVLDLIRENPYSALHPRE